MVSGLGEKMLGKVVTIKKKQDQQRVDKLLNHRMDTSVQV